MNNISLMKRSRISAMACRVLAIPYPIQGHINPLMRLAHLLALQGCSVSLAIPLDALSRILDARGKDDLDPVQLVGYHDGLPPDFDRYSNPVEFYSAVVKLGAVVEQLVEELTGNGLPFSCVVIDSFLPWGQRLARKFSTPWIVFWPQSSAVFSVYYHCMILGYAPQQSFEGERKLVPCNNAEDVITSIPGIPSFKRKYLPYCLQVTADELVYQFFCDQLRRASAADCILVNTFNDIERDILDSIKNKYPIHPVGPLLPSALLQGTNPHDVPSGSSLWKEEGCLQWLDKQAERSVLYISFGSSWNPTPAQFREIALALASTAQCFLWVIRGFKNAKSGPDLLPEGFLEGILHCGLVVSWAPQLQVLSHPAIGGFLTHCGWNSTLETISTGVPMLTLPQYSDQFMNSHFIANIWRVGIELQKNGKGVADRVQIEMAMKKVMQEEEGKSMRMRISDLREMGRSALRDGGSSHANLEVFVNEIKQEGKGWHIA